MPREYWMIIEDLASFWFYDLAPRSTLPTPLVSKLDVDAEEDWEREIIAVGKVGDRVAEEPNLTVLYKSFNSLWLCLSTCRLQTHVVYSREDYTIKEAHPPSTTALFLFWEYLFRIFGIVSLQCRLDRKLFWASLGTTDLSWFFFQYFFNVIRHLIDVCLGNCLVLTVNKEARQDGQVCKPPQQLGNIHHLEYCS